MILEKSVAALWYGFLRRQRAHSSPACMLPNSWKKKSFCYYTDDVSIGLMKNGVVAPASTTTTSKQEIKIN